MIKKIVDYFTGFVEFSLNGNFKSNFYEKLSQNNIKIYTTKKSDDNILIKVKSSDYKDIAKIAKNTNNKTKLKSKKGFFIFRNKYKKRIGLLAGIIIFLTALFVSQNFIWIIKYSSYDEKKLEYLKEELKQNGVKIGAYFNNIDLVKVKQNLLIKDNNLSRISLNRKGSILEVEISKREQNDDYKDKEPCNIVAEKTAQIIKIDNYKGQKEVVPLQIVTPGEILISGKEIDENGELKPVYADGKIIAQTYFDHTISFKYEQIKKEYYKTEKKAYLKFLNIKIPLFINYKENSKYDKDTKAEKIKLFGIKLPITKVTDTYKYYNEKKVKYSEEEVIDKIKKGFEEYEKNQNYSNNIIQKTDNITKENDKILITRKYIVQEEIGIRQMLLNYD